MGRTIWRVVAVVALVALAIGIGTWVYNAGVSAGLAENARAAGEAAEFGRFYDGPYIGAPWGFGFGFFGLLFGLLMIFLIIGLVRAAFGGPRWGGPPGWGDGGGRRALEELHRDLHRTEEEGRTSRSSNLSEGAGTIPGP